MKQNKLKNGVELMLSLALSLDLLEQYDSNRLLKRKINIAKDEIEKNIIKHYSQVYGEHEEFIQNSIRFKEKAIKKIAKYNEADCILACNYLDKFDDNIDDIRLNGNITFQKITQ